MLVNLIMMMAVDIGFEFLFEKLNQTAHEPFEKLQARTRYLKHKKVWQYSTLALAVFAIVLLCNFFLVNIYIVMTLLGLVLALVNTFFESTIYDQRRNTLR
ncbi:MAG: hypothetical protein RR448_09490 [Niameybacter sp.]|uniref:hypothetical protein n=1 Tax=Niameybacter sp. TaxID=2033640 RepID=UPI002FCB73ED